MVRPLRTLAPTLCAVSIGALAAVGMGSSGNGSPRLRLGVEKPSARAHAHKHVHEEDGGLRVCVYPAGRQRDDDLARAIRAEPLAVNEAEPNDFLGIEQFILLSHDQPEIDISGFIGSGSDLDLFRVSLEKGDLLDAAMGFPTQPDTIAAIFDVGGTLILANDDDTPPGGGSQSATYPASSPLLRTQGFDPKMTWVAPESGDYILLAQGFDEFETGPYTFQLRLRRGGIETMAPGDERVIFLDFDGALINAAALFGIGNSVAGLSPMDSFLSAWGLPNTVENQNTIIDGVTARVQDRLDALREHNPRLRFDLRNSRDHADPFGQPDVTRVIIGGTQQQLGIPTIGIAQSIDPGDYERAETAVVLLDALSTSGSGGAVQDVPRSASVSLIELVGRAVGNVAAHEIGHLLGDWHTVNDNLTPSVMDSGGGFILLNIFESGLDGVVGTADDQEAVFTTDFYPDFEGVGIADSIQRTGVRAAYALDTPVTCPADLTFDDIVDGADLGVLLSAWGEPGLSDLNADGVTDGADLGALLGRWGACP